MQALINTVAACATVAMPGVGEARLLTGQDQPENIAETYLDAGAREVVIKLGAEGAYAWSPTVRRLGRAALPSPDRHRRRRRRLRCRLSRCFPHRRQPARTS